MPPYEDKPLNMLAIEMTPHIHAIVNTVPWSHLPQDYVYGFRFVMSSMDENIHSVNIEMKVDIQELFHLIIQ